MGRRAAWCSIGGLVTWRSRGATLWQVRSWRCAGAEMIDSARSVARVVTSPPPSSPPRLPTTSHWHPLPPPNHPTYGSASSASQRPVGLPPIDPAEVERTRIFLAPAVAMVEGVLGREESGRGRGR